MRPGRRRTGGGKRKPSEDALHLTGFSFSAAARTGSGGRRPRPSRPVSTATRLARQRSEEDRLTAFLKSSFRVYLMPTPSVDKHATDCERQLRWPAVRDVVMLTHADKPVDCPICLDAPQLPRVTRCGHVFCALCILRHLLLGGGRNRCPICAVEVATHELRLVRTVAAAATAAVGETVEFALLQRSARSTVAARISDGRVPPRLPRAEEPHERFCRITVMTAAYLEERLAQEVAALGAAARELASSGDLQWSGCIDVAQTQLADLLSELDALRDSDGAEHAEEAEEEGGGGRGGGRGGAAGGRRDKFYYQLVDGQHVFLHPLCFRCLQTEFGSVYHMPRLLTARVVEVEAVQLLPAVRKRYAFLSHLPLLSELLFVEVDLTDLLSKATMATVGSALTKRRRKRQRLAAAAKREAKRAAEIEEQQRLARIAAYERMHIPPEPESYPSLAATEASAAAAAAAGDGGDAAAAAAAPALPPSPSLLADGAGEEWSFARITGGGYFPGLPAAAAAAAAAAAPSAAPSPAAPPRTAWAAAASSPTASVASGASSAWSLEAALHAGGAKKKKKNRGKKRKKKKQMMERQRPLPMPDDF